MDLETAKQIVSDGSVLDSLKRYTEAAEMLLHELMERDKDPNGHWEWDYTFTVIKPDGGFLHTGTIKAWQFQAAILKIITHYQLGPVTGTVPSTDRFVAYQTESGHVVYIALAP